ncbi:MAG: hypothetical protein H6735_06595 [Alphaproteobacteria bacterium]|nr:hypothetical protein [Alphaproteobacteria bacterium]
MTPVLLLMALACDTAPSRPGTFVGNPGGTDQLSVSSAGTTGVERGDGTARLERVVLAGCDGSEVDVDPATFPPDGLIQLSTERALTGIELPPGTWCGMEVSLRDAVLDFQVPTGTIHLAVRTLEVLLSEGDALNVDPQTTSDRKAEYGLVLSEPDWLAELVAQQPVDGLITPDELQQEALEGRMALASSLYDGEGRLSLHGPGYEPPELAQCETLPVPAVRQVIQDCPIREGYEVNSWTADGMCEPGLWIAGVYEARSDHSGEVHPMGEVSVTFDIPGQHVLALSSYEPVTWNVRVGPDTELRAILVAGYYEQIVRGTDVPVQRVSGPVCGYSYPYNGQGCNTDALIEGFENAIGLRATRFDGCYRATEMAWSPTGR